MNRNFKKLIKWRIKKIVPKTIKVNIFLILIGAFLSGLVFLMSGLRWIIFFLIFFPLASGFLTNIILIMLKKDDV
jgi:Na+-translocating ferredoxin:NAD+ oxidoreductase RnfE subunit